MIGKKIKLCRELNKYSQRDLAKISNISSAEISRIESGVRKNPGIFTILRICKVLNIPIEELLRGIEE